MDFEDKGLNRRNSMSNYRSNDKVTRREQSSMEIRIKENIHIRSKSAVYTIIKPPNLLNDYRLNKENDSSSDSDYSNADPDERERLRLKNTFCGIEIKKQYGFG